MKKINLFVFAVMFLLGWMLNSVYSYHMISDIDAVVSPSTGQDKQESIKDVLVKSIISNDPEEKSSPHDRIREDQIKVYNSMIVLDIQNAEWASFTDTNSMDPILDDGANAIEIVPKSEKEIHVGDIVSYRSDYADGYIIHRVVEIGEDSDGWYAIMKGDNIEDTDPGKIRFEQIERVVVAIIY